MSPGDNNHDQNITMDNRCQGKHYLAPKHFHVVIYFVVSI